MARKLRAIIRIVGKAILLGISNIFLEIASETYRR